MCNLLYHKVYRYSIKNISLDKKTASFSPGAFFTSPAWFSVFVAINNTQSNEIKYILMLLHHYASLNLNLRSYILYLSHGSAIFNRTFDRNQNEALRDRGTVYSTDCTVV